MKYAYDLLINYKKIYFDFYDWDKSDAISHVKKIPIFKIKDEDIINLLSYKIKFNSEFLEIIFKKSRFTNKSNEYSCIFYCEDVAFFVNINRKGNITEYSSLLIEDELDIIETNKEENITTIKYTILKKNTNCMLETRKERELKDKVKFKLKKLKDKSNFEAIKYIYLEFFGKEHDINYIIEDLEKKVNENFENINEKINDIFDLVR